MGKQKMEVKRYQKCKRIGAAIKLLDLLGVPYTRHNEDTLLNIKTHDGLMNYWPSTMKYRHDGYTVNFDDVACFLEDLKEIGFTPTRNLLSLLDTDSFRFTRETMRRIDAGLSVECLVSDLSEEDALHGSFPIYEGYYTQVITKYEVDEYQPIFNGETDIIFAVPVDMFDKDGFEISEAQP